MATGDEGEGSTGKKKMVRKSKVIVAPASALETMPSEGMQAASPPAVEKRTPEGEPGAPPDQMDLDTPEGRPRSTIPETQPSATAAPGEMQAEGQERAEQTSEREVGAESQGVPSAGPPPSETMQSSVTFKQESPMTLEEQRPSAVTQA